MSEVEVLYKCMVCGKAYGSAQALRGHMNAHRGVLKRTTIFVEGDQWDRFKEYCRDHNTTTCQVIRALVGITLKGAEMGIIKVPGPNPPIIQMNQYFLGRPRSAWEQEIDIARISALRPRCPECGSHEVRVVQPEGLVYHDGRCKKCGSEWLLKKGEG